MQGAELLADLVSVCQATSEITTAMLLERYRQENHYAALEKLAGHDHLLSTTELHSSFTHIVRQIVNSAAQQQLDALIAKAEITPLNADEKRQLSQLLQRQNQ